MVFICWYKRPSLKKEPCCINSKIEELRSSGNSFLPTFISIASVNILSLSHCNPSLVKKSTSVTNDFKTIDWTWVSKQGKRKICFFEKCSNYVAFDSTPCQIKSEKTSNSCSATSGFSALILFHSALSIAWVAKKVLNSWFNSSNCSFVNLEYFII